MTIPIEICKALEKDKWNIRTGDIEGATEISNLTEDELIEEIKEQLKIEIKLKEIEWKEMEH